MKHEVILEPSTNTHVMRSESVVETKDLGRGVLKLSLKGDGIVSHGEHGTIKTESANVIKYVQQEYNPVTRAMQNAFD
jgi:hypothetical protein